MPVTIKKTNLNSITITIPAQGESGWTQTVYDAFKKISEHNHTGGGNGEQLSTSSIADLSITTNKLADEAVTSAKLAALTSIQFAGGTGTQGTLRWNTDEETLDLDQDGTTLQLGQELHIHVKNTTGTTILNGTPVYKIGTQGNTGRLLVAPMIADGSIKESRFLGIATEDILDQTDGKVTTFGKVRDMDTSAFAENDEIFVSSTVAGELTNVEPACNNLKISVGSVINSNQNNGTIFVKISKASDLHHNNRITILNPDVDMNPQTADHLLVWNNVTKCWENKQASTASIADDAITAAKIPFISDTVASDAVQNDTLVWNATSGQFEPQAGGGGSSGGINHIPVASSDAEAFSVNSNDWTISDSVSYNVGKVYFSSDSNLHPLRGDYSFSFRALPGAQTGETIDIPFTVDIADRAKKHLISFDYKPYAPLGVNNFVDDAVRISIIKTVGGVDQEIRVNGEDIKAVTQPSTHYAQFQTDPLASSYKLRFTLKDVSATNAGSLILDNIKVSPVGVNDSVSSQAVYVVGTGSGGTYTITADTERIPFTILEDSTGSMSTTDNGPDTFTVPETGSYTIEGNVACGATTVTNQTINAFVNGSISRSLQTSDNGTDRYKHFSGILRLNKGDVLDFRFSAGADVIVENAGTHHWIHIEKIPSLSLPESVGSGRDIVLNLKTTTSPVPQHTNSGNWQIVPFGIVEHDTVGGWDASTNQYTIPETGYYDITGAVRTGSSSGAGLIAIAIDGSLSYPTQDGDVTTYTNTAQGFDITFTAKYLQKGQTVELQFFQSTGANLAYGQTGCYFQLAKRQSAQTVLDSRRDIKFRSVMNGNSQSITTTHSAMLYNSVDYDSTNSYDSSTGIYTAPETGYYSVNAKINGASAAYSAGGYIDCVLELDTGSGFTGSNWHERSVEKSDATASLQARLDCQIYLEKGHRVRILSKSTVSTTVFDIGSNQRWYSSFSIARLK